MLRLGEGWGSFQCIYVASNLVESFILLTLLTLEYIEDGVTVVFGGRRYLTVNIGQSNSLEK